MDAFKSCIVWKNSIVAISQIGDCYVISFKNDRVQIEKLTAAQQEREWYRPILLCLNQNIHD